MGNPVTKFFASRGFARGIGAFGRLMITSGTVILLLVAYQLWGTNLQTNKAQTNLQDEFASQLSNDAVVGPGSTTAPTTSPTTFPDATTTPVTTPAQVAPTVAPPASGEPAGKISIPSIGLRNFYFVEGVGVSQLKRGAGHYPSTPLPGQQGNAAIAGHRTTYAAPFHNIDKVKMGDPIEVQTLQGTFRYEVTGQKIVQPSDIEVLDPTPGPTLTLTACHPKFSARERIVTFAKLVGQPVAKLPNQDEVARQTLEATQPDLADDGADTGAVTRNSIDEFNTEPVVRFPGAWWGLGVMGLWLVIRLLAWQGHRSRQFPRWIPYVLGTPLCLVMLYFFFEAFSYEGFTRALNLNI